MNERVDLEWKLEGEGSSGRHLTGKRHSRRIQPRSLLSLLLFPSSPPPPTSSLPLGRLFSAKKRVARCCFRRVRGTNVGSPSWCLNVRIKMTHPRGEFSDDTGAACNIESIANRDDLSAHRLVIWDLGVSVILPTDESIAVSDFA